MDTISFDYASFFTMIFASMLTLVGVVVGSLVTYLYQSRLAKRQREWDLEDEKRQWNKNRLTTLLERYSQVMSLISRIVVERDKDPNFEDDILKNDLSRSMRELAALVMLYTEKMKDLHFEFADKVYDILYEFDNIDTAPQLEEVYSDIVYHITALIDDTMS